MFDSVFFLLLCWCCIDVYTSISKSLDEPNHGIIFWIERTAHDANTSFWFEIEFSSAVANAHFVICFFFLCFHSFFKLIIRNRSLSCAAVWNRNIDANVNYKLMLFFSSLEYCTFVTTAHQTVAHFALARQNMFSILNESCHIKQMPTDRSTTHICESNRVQWIWYSEYEYFA